MSASMIWLRTMNERRLGMAAIASRKGALATIGNASFWNAMLSFCKPLHEARMLGRRFASSVSH